jgi:hypothetical protein
VSGGILALPSSVGIVHNEDDRRKLVAVDACVESISEECVQWKRHFGQIRAYGCFMMFCLKSRSFDQDILMFCTVQASGEEWFGF